jgi:hypothetical protein
LTTTTTTQNVWIRAEDDSDDDDDLDDLDGCRRDVVVVAVV